MIFRVFFVITYKWLSSDLKIISFLILSYFNNQVFWPSSTQGPMRRVYGSRWSAVTSSPSFTYFGSASDRCWLFTTQRQSRCFLSPQVCGLQISIKELCDRWILKVIHVYITKIKLKVRPTTDYLRQKDCYGIMVFSSQFTVWYMYEYCT